MNIFTKLIAGQSLISWALQLVLIYLAWQVADHHLANTPTTIVIAGIVLVLTYASLAHDSKSRKSH